MKTPSIFSGAGPSTGVSPKSVDGLPIEVAGLHVLLNDALFGKEFVPMVRPKYMSKCSQ